MPKQRMENAYKASEGKSSLWFFVATNSESQGHSGKIFCMLPLQRTHSVRFSLYQDVFYMLVSLLKKIANQIKSMDALTKKKCT